MAAPKAFIGGVKMKKGIWLATLFLLTLTGGLVIYAASGGIEDESPEKCFAIVHGNAQYDAHGTLTGCIRPGNTCSFKVPTPCNN
jgi:hypothetical protein